jgi:hypothetical protein
VPRTGFIRERELGHCDFLGGELAIVLCEHCWGIARLRFWPFLDAPTGKLEEQV